MNIILTEDVYNLGVAGDVVEVANGYARNYLIPRNMAVKATKGNLTRVEQIKISRSNREEKIRKSMEGLAEKLEGLSLDIPVQVGEEDKVFGAVNQHMIVEALRAKGFNLERKTIHLDEPIRQLGVYSVEVHLHSDIKPKIRVWVVSS